MRIRYISANSVMFSARDATTPAGIPNRPAPDATPPDHGRGNQEDSQHHEHHQREPDRGGRAGSTLPGNVPYGVHRHLCRADRAEPRPYRENQPDGHRYARALDRADVAPDLGAHDRELRERGVEQALLQVGVRVQGETRQRGEDEQQGEQGEEAVYCDRGGKTARPRFSEAFRDRERDCEPRSRTLESVDHTERR